jgi:Nodulation protein Z (NodZ)
MSKQILALFLVMVFIVGRQIFLSSNVTTGYFRMSTAIDLMLPTSTRSYIASSLLNFPSFSQDLALAAARNKSTVEYRACCGLGHRLSKTVDAYHISRKKNYALRIFWDFCDRKTESFHYFFGPQPLSELKDVEDGRVTIKISNESPCNAAFRRKGNLTACPCPSDYMKHNGELFQSLVERFRYNHEVELFRRKHRFDNHLVLGMHVRAGNGETGDFTEKGRGILNMTTWLNSITTTILSISKDWSNGRPPLLFLATDTGSIVDDIRQELSGKMDVVVYEQERPPPGSGVFFGEHGSRDKFANMSISPCDQWKDALMDMMVLTSSDVIISGRPSSFTQSLPMGVALSRDDTSYCEVTMDATSYRCYQTFHEWCCLGATAPSLPREFLRMPLSNCEISAADIVQRPETETKFLASPKSFTNLATFLPYDWDHIDRTPPRTRPSESQSLDNPTTS